MKKKNKMIIIVLVMILSSLLLSFIVGNTVISQPAYAQIGADVKEKFVDAISSSRSVPLSEKEAEEYQKRLNAMDFRFAIPETYKQDIKEGTINVYISPVNQYETPQEWFTVSVKERVRLSQIPNELLKKMSTDELIIACLNYNLICDLYVCDTAQQGYENLKKQYNGIQELVKCSDSGSKLLKLYQSIDVKEFYEQDRFSIIRINLVGMLLSDEEVLKTLNKDQVKEIINMCYKKNSVPIDDTTSTLDYLTTTCMGLKCLYLFDKDARKIIDDCTELKTFIFNAGSFFTVDNIDDVTIGKIAMLIKDRYL